MPVPAMKKHAVWLIALFLLSACAEVLDDHPAGMSVDAVDTGDRQAVADFYRNSYLPDVGIQMAWTGSVAAKDAGSVGVAYRQATVRRLNYFRALCGLPSVGWDQAQSAKCQQAALMMSANDALNHYPPADWECYTADGAEAAGKSNLYLGVAGPPAIDGYLSDPGAGNSAVGHRRWILYPRLSAVGTGSVDGSGGYRMADALWVVGNTTTRPASPETVPWPSGGWFPRQHLPGSGRWSFSVADADWSATVITVTRGGSPVSITMEPVNNAGYGDRTIVWVPANGGPAGFSGPEDVWEVGVNGVKVNGETKNFTYTVRVFDPTAGD